MIRRKCGIDSSSLTRDDAGWPGYIGVHIRLNPVSNVVKVYVFDIYFSSAVLTGRLTMQADVWSYTCFSTRIPQALLLLVTVPIPHFKPLTDRIAFVATPHSLRHAFATMMLEERVAMRVGAE